MKRKIRRKKVVIESIDRMVASDADIYVVDRALGVWTIRPVMEETVGFVMRLDALLDLNPSQRETLIRAIADALYPGTATPSGWVARPWKGVRGGAFRIPQGRSGFRVNDYEGIPIRIDRPQKKSKPRRRKTRTGGLRRERRRRRR